MSTSTTDTVTHGPLAHGLLTGSMGERTFAADDWRSDSTVFEGDAFRRNLDVVSELERFAADELGTEMGRLSTETSVFGDTNES